jgi:hypothetical protein
MSLENDPFKSKKRRKPSKEFQRTVWLQIYIPLIVIILVLIGVVTLFWVEGVGTFSGWADTALVFLLIPALLLGLILIVLIAAISFGIFYIIGEIPGPARQAQDGMRKVASETRRLASLVVKPFFAPKAAGSAVNKAIRHMASIFSVEETDRGD